MSKHACILNVKWFKKQHEIDESDSFLRKKLKHLTFHNYLVIYYKSTCFIMSSFYCKTIVFCKALFVVVPTIWLWSLFFHVSKVFPFKAQESKFKANKKCKRKLGINHAFYPLIFKYVFMCVILLIIWILLGGNLGVHDK